MGQQDQSQKRKHRAVLFLKDNVRIIITDDPSTYRGIPGVLIDPDLSAVKGHPPHYWKMDKGKVVPISNEEKVRRDGMRADLKWDEFARDAFIAKVRKTIRNERLKYGSAAIVIGVALMVALRAAF